MLKAVVTAQHHWQIAARHWRGLQLRRGLCLLVRVNVVARRQLIVCEFTDQVWTLLRWFFSRRKAPFVVFLKNGIYYLLRSLLSIDHWLIRSRLFAVQTTALFLRRRGLIVDVDINVRKAGLLNLKLGRVFALMSAALELLLKLFPRLELLGLPSGRLLFVCIFLQRLLLSFLITFYLLLAAFLLGVEVILVNVGRVLFGLLNRLGLILFDGR